MGDYPYTWYAPIKGCSKPLNLSFAEIKQNLCLQHLVVLPLLGILQLCFLVNNHHQPPRMAACPTICTGSGHGTKASKLGHIPSSNYNAERKQQGKKTIPKIKWWDDRRTHICALKYPRNQLSVIQSAHYSFNPYSNQDPALGLLGSTRALPTATFRTCISSFLMHTRHAAAPAAGQDVIVLMDSCWQEVLSPPKPTESSQSWNLIFPSLQILPSWRPQRCWTTIRP